MEEKDESDYLKSKEPYFFNFVKKITNRQGLTESNFDCSDDAIRIKNNPDEDNFPSGYDKEYNLYFQKDGKSHRLNGPSRYEFFMSDYSLNSQNCHRYSIDGEVYSELAYWKHPKVDKTQ
jgi:hypothetical protein